MGQIGKADTKKKGPLVSPMGIERQGAAAKPPHLGSADKMLRPKWDQVQSRPDPYGTPMGMLLFP